MSADWSISIWQSGNSFVADGFINRPNQDLETKRISNLQIIKLANGSEAFMQPETKYFKDTFSMFFANTTSAFRTKIENYIVNGDKVKIVTHDSQTFYGFFIDINRVWFSGQTDTFDCALTFKESIS
jgi:hypothetical protein